MSRRRLLLTGFEPFGDDPVNPSAQLVERLCGQSVVGHTVLGEVLPVDSARVGAALRRAIERDRPAMVLLTGLAAGRTSLSLETGATNLLDFDRPDNAGHLPQGCRISEHGADRLFTNLPVGNILTAWGEAGIPGEISDCAGTYVCNQALYEVLALNERSIPTGFIHLPCTPALAEARAESGSRPFSLSLEQMQLGIVLSIEATLGIRAGTPS